MKALLIIPLFFAAFFIFLGLTTGKSSRDPLSITLIVGGVLVAFAVLTIGLITFIKEKRDERAKTRHKNGFGDS